MNVKTRLVPFSLLALVGLVSPALMLDASVPAWADTPAAAPAPTHAWRTWEQVFSAPTALKVSAYQTGFVFTGPKVLIDAEDPRTPANLKRKQWVPAISYLVEHPRAGRFLMDTGVPRAGKNGACDFGVRPFFNFKCKARQGQNIADQLRRDGVRTRDLKYAMVSHLHGDHAGGLAALAEDGGITIAVSPREWTAATRTLRMVDGYIRSQVRAATKVVQLPFERAIEMPHLGRSLDLFGDGSVWVFEMPGHTRGELSVLLNTTSGPLFFTFDASHLAANTKLGINPGFTVDKASAHTSLMRIGAFLNAYPRATAFYGHDPAQWAGKPDRVPLTR